MSSGLFSIGANALSAAYTALRTASNNIANVNTTAFKSSRIGFGELLSQTLAQAFAVIDLAPHGLGPGLGTKDTDPQFEVSEIDPLGPGLFGHEQGIGGGAGQNS